MKAKEQIRRTRIGSGGRLAAECGIHLLLAAVLAGAVIPEECAPFAVALVGAAGCGVCGAAALVGACFGYLCLMGLTQGLRHAAACVLVFAVAYAFYDARLLRQSWVMPAVTGAVTAFTQAVVRAQLGWDSRQAVILALEAVLAGGAAAGYRWALLPLRERGEQTASGSAPRWGILLLLVTVCMALRGVAWGQVLSLGGVLAMLASVSVGWQGGAGMGAVSALGFGLGLDLTGQAAAVYTAVCPACAAAAGLCRGKKRWKGTAAGVLAALPLALWLESLGTAGGVLYEALCGCLLFQCLPERPLRRLGAWLAPEQPAAADRGSRQRMQQRLEQTSRAFSTLSRTLLSALRPPRNDNDVAVVFDRAAGQVCSGCPMQNRCWTQEYSATFGAMNDATAAMVARRRALPEDFPKHFADRCLHFSAYVQAVNEQYTALLYRRQYQTYVRENRAAVCRQYEQLSQLLSDAATELGEELAPDMVLTHRLRRYLEDRKLKARGEVLRDERGFVRVQAEGEDSAVLAGETGVAELSALLRLPLRLERHQEGCVSLLQEEPLMAVAGVAARRRDGETVSGDAGTYFKREDGKLYVLLCDGMGSGAQANRESTLAVRLLEQFIRAGVSSRQALQTLSYALALRGEDCGGFTTVDLLQVDLFTGQALLLKMGAAPTFLRQKGQVRRLAGERLPAGLEQEGQADEFSFTLEPGDCVLMVSDGVCPAEEDGWLRERLEAFDSESPKELARALLTQAPLPGTDDRTALVIRIARRG